MDDNGLCPGHNWDDEGSVDAGVVLPLDLVVGVESGAPMASCVPMSG